MMERFSVNDQVIYQGLYGPHPGVVLDIADEATGDVLYSVKFGDGSILCLDDSKLMSPDIPKEHLRDLEYLLGIKRVTDE